MNLIHIGSRIIKFIFCSASWLVFPSLALETFQISSSAQLSSSAWEVSGRGNYIYGLGTLDSRIATPPILIGGVERVTFEPYSYEEWRDHLDEMTLPLKNVPLNYR